MQIIEMYLCVTLPCPLLAENTTTAEKKGLQYTYAHYTFSTEQSQSKNRLLTFSEKDSAVMTFLLVLSQ